MPIRPIARRLLAGALLMSAAAIASTPTARAAPAPYTLSGSVPAADGPWDYASVDAASHRLLLGRGDGVLALDLDSGAVTPTLVAGRRVHGVITLPGGLAVSTNGDSATATLFHAADGAIVATLPTGRKPDAVVREPRTGLVAVMNGKDGTVTLIDPAAGAVAGGITVGGALEFAVADGRGRVFVNVEDRNEVVALDIASRAVLAHYPLPDCDGPTGLALDPATATLVAACGNGKAVALSTDGKARGTVAIGRHPDAVIFDEKNHRFLVPAGGDGVLNVLAEAADGTLTPVAAVTTAKGARTGALDPRTGKVYLPVADTAPAATATATAAGGTDGHAVPVPGSFRILILSPS